MGRPSASYKREFNRNMKTAAEEANRVHSEKMSKLLSGNGQAVKQMHKTNRELFDALQVGDSLACFGIAGEVEKKNKKSVITGLGSRYTLKELGVE